MPKYHFEIADGVTLPDPIGTDCRNADHARREAAAIAKQIATDLGDHELRSVIVVDEKGEELCRVPIKTERCEDSGDLQSPADARWR
jgi:hypothetical protein